MIDHFRLLTSAFVIALLPSILCRPILRLLGHKIGKQAKLGFSLVLTNHLTLQGTARIGHFNLLFVRRISMRRGAYLGRRNIIHGPISIALAERAAIGNNNKIVRGPLGHVSTGPASLRLGELSKITSEHRLDCTRSIHIGAFSTIAGTACQLWTHGYVHDDSGPGRYRIDAPIQIENNVYIGSACIINAGVSIKDGVMIGSGTTVASDLTEPGLYVSAPVRALPKPAPPSERQDLLRVDDPRLVETVYFKTRH